MDSRPEFVRSKEWKSLIQSANAYLKIRESQPLLNTVMAISSLTTFERVGMYARILGSACYHLLIEKHSREGLDQFLTRHPLGKIIACDVQDTRDNGYLTESMATILHLPILSGEAEKAGNWDRLLRKQSPILEA